jgi:A-macroglobulin TED domain/Alpha-2-macroglobulin family/Carboxypeptidase regulatory-like domain/MG2 domain/A-macroglobulin receptor binding domain/Alpha-2-macroglobulin bait region domain
MTQLWRYRYALVWLAFLIPALCRADQSLRVNSAKTKIQLQGDALRITLGLDNTSGRSVPAQVTLELLDPHGQSRGEAQREQNIPRGLSKSDWVIQLSGVKTADLDDVFWYRLRYRIEPSSSAESIFEPVSGILSVSQIAPAMFRLEYAGPSAVRLGARFEALVRAVQPATYEPVAGVYIRATADVSDTGAIPALKASATTDSQGYARLEFLLPANADSDSPSIDITGERGGYTAKLDDEQPRTFVFSTFRVNTDKALYQPGQTLHARVLVVGPNPRAVTNHSVEFRVYDPENTLVFREAATTSKFGIASTDWPIPSNERLGDYRVAVDAGEGDTEDIGGSAMVKISRYDLPTFTVNAKPNRKYYLPGQNAVVEVSAEYRFGKPVARGHVRVIRDDEREWNYQQQEWEVHPGKIYEGETNSAGDFVANIDLSKDHKALADDDYLRFRDISYTTYFTDPTTGRTEHRRFDLRLTKDRIHIYVMPAGESTVKHTVDFYLSTYYADGTPARCAVGIRSPSAQALAGSSAQSVLLRTVHTNAYGLAKVFDMAVPAKNIANQQLGLTFEAEDKSGASGKHTEDFWFYGSGGIRVETDKALYRSGDPIDVSLTSDDANATVEVGADSQWRFIASQMVHLHDGKAAITLGASDQFEGPVTIYAYELGKRPKGYFGDTYAQGTHTVLFPHDTSLKVDVRMSKSTYRPGEEAEANFHVQSADGGSAESALGIVAVDKAVEERERSDADLQNPWQYVAFSTDWSDSFNLSGVSRADLNKIDLSKPLPPGFDLLAEILLQSGADMGQFDDSGGEPNLHTLFSSAIDPPLAPVLAALRAQIEKDSNPEGANGIREFLGTTNLGDLQDPWGTAYGVAIEPSGTDYKISITSAGPDQKMGSGDDFEVASEAWPYFAPYAAMIQKAAEDYHSRTGGYIRDANVLESELLRRGVDFYSLHDPWQHAYRVEFGIEQNFYTIEVRSAGPDGIFSSPDEPSTDDVAESRSVIGYFDDTREKMDAALQRYYHDQGLFPQNQQELTAALAKAGIDWESLRDPWGHEYYATFRTEAKYSDAVVVQSYSEYAAGQHTAIHPVTASINYIDIRSNGPDGKKGTIDDFDAAMFSRAIYAEATGHGSGANTNVIFSGELGAISGTVTDPSGAAITNASVTATRYGAGETYRAESDGEGHFLLRNLKPGAYEVRVVSTGFRDDVFTQVPVGSSVVTQLNAVMQIGAVTQTVMVEAQAAQVQTQASTASVAVAKRPNGTATSPGSVTQIASLSTPRLREYFPETLLWRPEVITSKRGAAEIKFPLADSITTWHLKVIASTVDGRIGTAEKEVRAFQPFFADEDLPQFLTAGDKIDLPVVVRNFLSHAEPLSVSLTAQSWLAMLGPNVQHTQVAADSSERLSFPIRAQMPNSDGGLRVVAIGKSASDAIERKTTVRPFGEEQVAADSQMLNDSSVLNISIPQNALPGSVNAELKVYPNLMAHVWEAMGAILERPWGCGEQTISSTYPSILLLQYAKRAGREDSAETLKARHFAQLGYDRLLSYQTADGGFSYWGHGDAADLSLTAYAVMFLRDAKQVIPVDEQVIRQAQRWLLNQMKPDGHWPAEYYWNSQTEDTSRSAIVTAYVARVLASSEPVVANEAEGQKLAQQTDRDVARALDWLGPRTHQVDEPYLIASYALALFETNNAGNRKLGLDALERLKSLTHHEENANYWSLETNTPFYGWGHAGVLETSALVLQAFEQAPGKVPETNRALIDGGILYLLHNQDQYGIWYTTQATINVLSAMAESIASSSAVAGSNVGTAASVLVDGKAVAQITLPPANELSAPVVVDLSKSLGPGEHRIEVSRAPGAAKASVQIAATYYVPWKQYTASQALRREKGSAEALRLSVKYDKTNASVGEAVTCTVKAERVDFRGYGMMLTEIGLPPGAEVDRASLEKAMKDSGWDVNQFDVQPDRVIVYLWPRAGGTSFSFSFTTRFGFEAETTPSVLYDYYNPDARAVVAPTRITVR